MKSAFLVFLTSNSKIILILNKKIFFFFSYFFLFFSCKFNLAADYKYNSVHELEGQLEGLKYIDLEKEGLGEYRAQLIKLGNNK